MTATSSLLMLTATVANATLFALMKYCQPFLKPKRPRAMHTIIECRLHRSGLRSGGARPGCRGFYAVLKILLTASPALYKREADYLTRRFNVSFAGLGLLVALDLR
jgi:hypothetical protein